MAKPDLRVLAFSLLASGCASPTAMTVDVYSEVGCDKNSTVALIGGKNLSGLGTQAPSSVSTRCTDQGNGEMRMGNVVLLPGGSKDEAVAFALMTRTDGGSADNCLDPSEAPRCIVAKRQLHFIPHTNLNIRIDLRLSCAGVTCPTDQTCIKGQCVTAIVRSNLCDPKCDETSFLGDSGNAADSGPSVDVCGDTSGLPADAPWPLTFGCPTNAGRSRFAGPTTGNTLLASAPIDSGLTGLVVGANKQVMVAVYNPGSSAAYDQSSGQQRWHTSTPGARPYLAVDAQNNVLVGSDHGVYYCLDAVSGAMRWQIQLNGSFREPVIGPPGMAYFGAEDYGVYGLDIRDIQGANQKWHFDVPGGGRPTAPAIGKGTLYFLDLRASHLFALNPATGTQIFNVAVTGTALGSPVLGVDGIYAATETHGIAAFDPQSGALKWQQPAMSEAVVQPALLANGNIVSSTASGTAFVLDRSDGNELHSFSLGGTVSSPPILAVDDTAYYSTSSGISAVTPLDGKLVWQSKLTGPIWLGDGVIIVLPNGQSAFATIGP